MRIGIVDLDTSHPGSWIPVEREMGHEIVGVWDGGSVHPENYAKQFASEREIPRVFDNLEDMVEAVDCAFIHSCDWDTHVNKARPFVEAGKPVLIDKPIAGNLKDLKQMLKWSEKGVRITGGSSLRFCVETQEWLAKPLEERGEAHATLCGCGVDEFNYGIHAYSMLGGIMGPGITSVRHLSNHVQRKIQVSWSDGRMGFVVVGTATNWIPFYASISTDRSPALYQCDNSKLYGALLEKVLPYLSGQSDQPPIMFRDLMESELCAIAARKSWLEGNREVKLSELSESDGGYDGKEFAEEYKRARYPDQNH